MEKNFESFCVIKNSSCRIKSHLKVYSFYQVITTCQCCSYAAHVWYVPIVANLCHGYIVAVEHPQQRRVRKVGSELF